MFMLAFAFVLVGAIVGNGMGDEVGERPPAGEFEAGVEIASLSLSPPSEPFPNSASDSDSDSCSTTTLSRDSVTRLSLETNPPAPTALASAVFIVSSTDVIRYLQG